MELKRLVFFGLFLFSPLFLSAKHYGPSYDAKPRNALDLFAKSLAKKHQLNFIGSGLGDLAGSKEGVWAISLTSGEKLTIDQARELAAELSYQLLYKMYHDPLFTTYSIERPKELNDQRMGFRLAFWDENTNRPMYPYVAQVRLADGNLYFHYADPTTQALQEPIIESLESLQLPPYK